MLKRFARRINLNFRQSKSDRSATNSYRDYHGRVKRIFDKVKNFSKINKYDKS